jgi:tetratricopeptide (TPR) repeat protein
MRRSVVVTFFAALLGLVAAPFVAHAHAEVGTQVNQAELKAASGERVKIIDARAKVTVLVFVRTGQDRSVDALKAMARCEKDLAGKPVRFVGVVPPDTTSEEAKALAIATGVKMPLVFDAGDALYNHLAVRLHPVIFLLDAKAKVADFEQYRQIDYCEVVTAHIRFLLGDLDQAALDLIEAPPKGSMPGADPKDVSNRDVNLGRRQLQIKQFDKATASANKALAMAPNAGAFALLGEIAAAKGDCAAALRHFDQALKLDPAEKYALAGKQGCGKK